MTSVTNRIKAVSQPRGGYLNPKLLSVTQLDDGLDLYESKSNSSLLGMAVDYLTRYCNGAKIEDAFRISILGASVIGERDEVLALLGRIKGLDSESIRVAYKTVGYDVCYRVGCLNYVPVEQLIIDENGVENVKIMVNRSINFIKEYGPIVKDGFTFEGGYTNTVDTGDGDFLTVDTLWDFKVSKADPKKEHTLQLIMYYLMGKHSKQSEFENIKHIGIFNPRLNRIYTHEISKIDPTILKEIESDVIGY